MPMTTAAESGTDVATAASSPSAKAWQNSRRPAASLEVTAWVDSQHSDNWPALLVYEATGAALVL